jgi:hypothetical protein
MMDVLPEMGGQTRQLGPGTDMAVVAEVWHVKFRGFIRELFFNHARIPTVLAYGLALLCHAL